MTTTEALSAEKLEPCPLCGGTNIGGPYADERDRDFYVACISTIGTSCCQARGRTRASAVVRWNTRAARSEPPIAEVCAFRIEQRNAGDGSKPSFWLFQKEAHVGVYHSYAEAKLARARLATQPPSREGAESGWRDIETAPKDRQVDLWAAERDRYANERIPDCRLIDGRWMHTQTIYDDRDDEMSEVFNATHWAPLLPPPPTSEVK